MSIALDSAEVRPLNQREIVKLFAGVIGSMVCYDSNVRPDIRAILELAATNPGHLEEADRIAREDFPGQLAPPTWAAVFAATVLSLRTWCKHHDIQTALMWISHNLETICPRFPAADVSGTN